MLEKRIKSYMDDIIDVAFRNKPDTLRKRYKNYRLYILTKENSRSSGIYHPDGHVIQIYNPSLGTRHLAKVCLHELSHHIDYIDNGISGHQKPFYERYEKLIYAALDMGILNKDDFDDDWSSDQNKVRKIVEGYHPLPIQYEANKSPIICVYNAFSVKDDLKLRGYRWNKLEQVWEKEVFGDTGTEEFFLKDQGAVKTNEECGPVSGLCYIIKDSQMYIDPIIYIEASGDTYNCKEALKRYHFFYNKDRKKWLCKIKAKDKDSLLMSLHSDEELTGCRFTIQNRKEKRRK